MLRVLIVQGSMSGTTGAVAKKFHSKWSGEAQLKFSLAPNVISGNEAADQFDTLCKNYDVLLVVTSSHGDGDPPDNYVKFLRALISASEAGSKPLAGLQHAVLGFGDTTYDTFQNCPRLTDKLLEDLGSRRLHKRFEIDADHWGDEVAAKNSKLEKEWPEGVFKALQSNPSKDAPPVCKWNENGETITPKTLEYLSDPLLFDVGEKGTSKPMVLVGLLVLIIALLYAFVVKKT